MVVWTPEQMGTFVRHVREDRFYALWMLAATTGMRRGELAGLLASDIDFKHARVTSSRPRVSVDGQVLDSDTKTEAGHRVMALVPGPGGRLRRTSRPGARSEGCLASHRRCCSSGRMAHPCTPTQSPRCSSATWRRRGIRLHDVRHCYATAALASGTSPKIVSERLGHASAAFTMQT
jgi:integrase